MAMQAKLLRVLQEREVERVGGTRAGIKSTYASSRPPTSIWNRPYGSAAFDRTCSIA